MVLRSLRRPGAAWVLTFWLWPSIDGWALVIDTFASTITFLLVALCQNTETRAENATQRKLNAIAVALADLMAELEQTIRVCAVRETNWLQRSESNTEKARKDNVEVARHYGLRMTLTAPSCFF